MKRFHGICKYPNGDGSPLDLMFWSPYTTYRLVLILKVMPSYFPTAHISESTALIFYPAYFCYRQKHISVIYWSSFWGEILLLLNLCVHSPFNVWSLLYIYFPWSSTFEYFTCKLLHIVVSFCEHRYTKAYWKSMFH